MRIIHQNYPRRGIKFPAALGLDFVPQIQQSAAEKLCDSISGDDVGFLRGLLHGG